MKKSYQNSERKIEAMIEVLHCNLVSYWLILPFGSNGTEKWASGFLRANKTREQERAFDENNVITVILTLLTLEFFY